MATYRLFPTTNGPATATSFGGPYGTGTKFKVTAGGLWLAGYWWWVCAAGSQDTAAQQFCLWQVFGGAAGQFVPGTEITSGALSAGWNYVPYATPLPLSAGITYQGATAFTGAFPDTPGQYASGGAYAAGIANGPLIAFSDSSGTNPDPYSNSQSTYQTGTTDPSVMYASNSNGGFNGWLDIQVTDAAPSGASIRLWPSMPDNLSGLSSDTTGYILACEFALTTSSTLGRIWHYSPPGAAALPTRCALWVVSTQTEVPATDNSSPAWLLPGGGAAAAGDGYCYCDYTTAGVTLAASTNYKVSTYHASGSTWMSVTTTYWSAGAGASGISNDAISAPDNAGATPGQGSYQTTWAYPSLTIAGGENYWIDVEVTPLTAITIQGVAAITAAASVSELAVLGSGSIFTAAALTAAAARQLAPVTIAGQASAAPVAVLGSSAGMTGAGTQAASAVQLASATLSGLAALVLGTATQLTSLAFNGIASITSNITQLGRAAFSGIARWLGISGPAAQQPPQFNESALGGSAAPAHILGGTVTAVSMSAMQNLQAFENNDTPFQLEITQNGYPLNLTPYTLKLYVKASQTALDATATIYTIGSGLAYNTETAGMFTWDLPHTAVTAPGNQWWRVDIVDQYGNVGTALYGSLVIIAA